MHSLTLRHVSKTCHVKSTQWAGGEGSAYQSVPSSSPSVKRIGNKKSIEWYPRMLECQTFSNIQHSGRLGKYKHILSHVVSSTSPFTAAERPWAPRPCPVMGSKRCLWDPVKNVVSLNRSNTELVVACVVFLCSWSSSDSCDSCDSSVSPFAVVVPAFLGGVVW